MDFIADKNKFASGRYFAAVTMSIGAVAVAVLCMLGVIALIIVTALYDVTGTMNAITALLQIVLFFMSLVGQVIAFYFGTKAGKEYAEKQGGR